uniref:Uncharacterized protein n=1 Tax=Arundo donax TaxID=35708 RepID=A0A0A9A3V4_ARUDO
MEEKRGKLGFPSRDGATAE